MNYIVFGCGKTGTDAFNFLSPARIAYYADNYNYGKNIYGKSVISYEKMVEICKRDKDTVVVIASEKHWIEMEKQLCESGIKSYFVFHESDICLIHNVFPHYFLYKNKIEVSYTKSLSHGNIARFKHIAIYGVNHFLPYLIAEIMEQTVKAEIIIIPQKGYTEKIYSLGYPILCPQEIWEKEVEAFDCIILNIGRNEDDIRERLEESGDHQVKILDLNNISDIEPAFYHQELKKYKNIYKGKRIFVIGNGPSLKFADLDKLHEHREICIAFNKIYKAYNRTKWRADYVGFSDYKIIKECFGDLLQIPGDVFVADTYHTGGNHYMEGIQYYHEFREEFYPNYPGFSDNFTRGFFSGMTATYGIGIQLAAYMGASEIYLLGVDNSITGNLTDSSNHFLEDYYSEDEKRLYEGVRFEQEKLVMAYKKAEIYSRRHGFRIFNATRGGELEVFERVGFDNLF